MTKAAGMATGLISGTAFGVLGTVLHQTHISGFPIGLTLAFTLVAAYGLSIRRSKVRSWSFAIGISGTVFVAAQEWGSDVLISANPIGFIWSFGALGISLLVAMAPRLP